MAATFRKGVDDSNSTTVATDATVDIPAGAGVVVAVTGQEWSFSGGTVSVADDASGGSLTYTSVISDPGTLGAGVQIFKAVNSGGARTGVTITSTWTVSQRYKVIHAWICDDLNTSSGFPEDFGGLEDSGVSSITVSGIDTTADARIFAIASSSNDRTWTADTGDGFTEDYDVMVATGAGSSGSQSKLQTGSGSYAITATPDSASNLIIAAAAFKTTGGGSPALDDSGSFPGFEAQSNPLVISVW